MRCAYSDDNIQVGNTSTQPAHELLGGDLDRSSLIARLLLVGADEENGAATRGPMPRSSGSESALERNSLCRKRRLSEMRCVRTVALIRCNELYPEHGVPALEGHVELPCTPDETLQRLRPGCNKLAEELSS